MAITPTATNIYLVPFEVKYTTKFDRLAIDVTTAEEYGLCKLGIYSSTPDGIPDAKLLQTNELDLNATGVVEDTISVTLTPGRYWLAFSGDTTTAQLTSVSVGGIIAKSTADASTAKMVTGVNSYSTGDDLPTDVGTITYSTSDPPLIALRAS